MPVYSYRMMSDLTSSLEGMARTFFSRMPLLLDPDEFIAAFIAPEHVGKLREVEELVGFTGMNVLNTDVPTTDGVAIKVTIGFGMRPPVILPRYAANGLQPTCPDHVRERIVAWADERLRFGYAFGDAFDALQSLNEICADKRALVTMLPCFPTIMGSISDDAEAKTTKTAQAMAQNKSVSKLPRLPREVKERLLEVSAIVNSVSLMKDAPLPETPKHYAMMQRDQYKSLQHTRFNIFDLDKPMQHARSSTFI